MTELVNGHNSVSSLSSYLSISTSRLDSVILTLGLASSTGGEGAALEGTTVGTHLGDRDWDKARDWKLIKSYQQGRM